MFAPPHNKGREPGLDGCMNSAEGMLSAGTKWSDEDFAGAVVGSLDETAVVSSHYELFGEVLSESPTLGLNVGVKNSFSFAADLHSAKYNLCVGVEDLKVRDPHSGKTPCESVKDGLSLVGRASEDLKYVE